MDYLLKPISLDHFLAVVENTEQSVSISPSLSPNFIFVKSGYKTQKVAYEEILYFEGLSDYVAIHTAEEKILTLEKMKDFEKTLPQNSFIRVHKSFIVSIGKIEYIERNRIIIGDKYIPIGATYGDNFWERIKK